MAKKKMAIRFLIHLLFWGGFIILFIAQNPNAGINDYILWLFILSVNAVVVYCNLYILLISYFLKKRYFHYFGFLSLLILAASFVLSLLLPAGHPFFSYSILSTYYQYNIFYCIEQFS